MRTLIETKLAAARARLCMERPFLGALVVHLPFARAPWCRSVATDARTLYFDPQYIDRLDLAQTQFVLAHVALHCALGHFARRGHRLVRRWDIACDYAVNGMLVDDGLAPPEGALHDARFRGMAAEEIYPLVSDEGRPLDLHAFGGWPAGARSGGSARRAASHRADDRGGGDPIGLPESLRAPAPADGGADRAASMRALLQAWQIRLAQAAQQAELAGRLGASWQRALGRLLVPELPWRALLARYLSAAARDDYSFQRSPRRDAEALLPGLHSRQAEVCVVLDTSGSITDAQLREFVAEIDALKAQVRARVTLHACDSALSPQGPWIAEAWEPIALPPALAGGGGTDFRPVFDWIAARGLRPDALVYLTDAEGEFPPAPPVYPVLWVVKGRGIVPWGERIQLN